MFVLNLILLKCSSTIDSLVNDCDIGSSQVENIKEFFSTVNHSVSNTATFTSLYVECNKFITLMPNDIGILKKTNIFRFINSNVSELPPEFVNLKELISLDFISNNFKIIPKEIFFLLKLRYLNFDNNKLESISNEIIKLEYLQFLNVNYNQLETIPNCLYLLKNLRYLAFDQNYCQKIRYYKKWFQRLNQVPQMEKLEVLSIEENLIKDISTDFLPPNLRVLKLSANRLKTLPRNLSKWTNLEELYITRNDFITFPSIKLPIYSLRILSLECVKIKKEVVLNDVIFPKLRSLDLTIDQIDQTKPLRIKSNNLKKLSLSINTISILDLSGIIVPKLEQLILNDNIFEITNCLENVKCLTGNPYTICCNLNHIKILRIVITTYKDEDMKIPILKELKGSEYLEELIINGAFLKEFPSEILNCTNLNQINLSHNKISKIPNEISQLQKLKYLNMTDNNLSEINRNIFDIKILKEGKFDNNNIKYLPKEYKMFRGDIISFDIKNLDLGVCGDDLGFLDLSEKYLRLFKLPDLFIGDYCSVAEIYDFIETGSTYWNLEKVLSIKPDEIKKSENDFTDLNNIWITYLLPNIEDKDLLEVWNYINTIYKVPGSTFIVPNVEFVSGMKTIKDYIGNIFDILKQRVINKKKDVVPAVFILIQSGIYMCFDGQLEAWRTAFLSLNNDYDENLPIKKFINDALANIKENCLRKITTSNSDSQNVHIFSYWKDKLDEKLGFTKSKRAYPINGSLDIYKSQGYILYRFFKEFRPETVIKEILEILNNNNEIITNISKKLFHEYEDLSKIESFFEYQGEIEDRCIHKITFEGLLCILKDLELIVEKDMP